uniref:C-type lectin domain-containing protein n=1 Tax=Oncorhynchus mykiss TaxID=8022 RepID=A0A8C7UVP3_ONCMY
MARLVLPIFLVLSLTLLHRGYSRPSRTRKAVPASQRDEDDEVNSLKEISALQTVYAELAALCAHTKCCFMEPKRYHEANEHSIAWGGTLATPRDLNENNVLRDYAKRSAPGTMEFWIGVTDIVKEGQYVDINSMPISYFNWDKSKKQLTGTKRESCVVLSLAAQGKWHDEVCLGKKKYIYEYPIP